MIRAIVTFFGIGLAPFAPGTFGSLATLPVVAAIAWMGGAPAVLFFVVATTAVGIVAASLYSAKVGKDPSEVVIDEVAGQALALSFVALDWRLYVLGFLLFRLFDILKPPPIKWFEALPSGTGIMADDLVAGAFAAIILYFVSGFIV